ncbi:MAG: hypothetical protein ACUVWB_02100 [Anaerolineae bacterium]
MSGQSWAEYALLVIFLSLMGICLYVLLGPGLDQVYYSLAGPPAPPPPAVTTPPLPPPTPGARTCTAGWLVGAVEALDTNADNAPDRLRLGGPRHCLLLLPAGTSAADPLLSDMTADPPRLRCLQVEDLNLGGPEPTDTAADILPAPGAPALRSGRLIIQRLELTAQRLELEGLMTGWQSGEVHENSVLAQALAAGAVPLRVYLTWHTIETPPAPQKQQERPMAWGWARVPLNVPCS